MVQLKVIACSTEEESKNLLCADVQAFDCWSQEISLSSECIGTNRIEMIYMSLMLAEF